MNQDVRENVSEVASVRGPRITAIRWGAVLAGIVVGLSVNLLLAFLGMATGLTAADTMRNETGISWAMVIWTGVSMLIAAFVGGYVAAVMSGLRRTMDGVLHGTVAWGATTLLAVVFSSSIIGGLFGTLFSGVAQGTTAAAQQVTQQADIGSIVQNIDPNVNPEALNQQNLSQLQQYVTEGNRQGLMTMLTQEIGLSQSNARTVADVAMFVGGNVEQASEQAAQAAEQANAAAQGSMWTIFGIIALSLILGMTGGMTGIRKTRRHPEKHHHPLAA